MTKDEAIAVGKSLDMAIMALRETYNRLPPVETIEEGSAADNARESIEEAMQAAETARSLVRNISGA